MVNVRSNFFEVTKLPTVVTHYDISISSDMPPPVNRRIFEQLVKSYRASDLGGVLPVFDGRRNLFSTKELPFESRTFDVSEKEQTKEKNADVGVKKGVCTVTDIPLHTLFCSPTGHTEHRLCASLKQTHSNVQGQDQEGGYNQPGGAPEVLEWQGGPVEQLPDCDHVPQHLDPSPARYALCHIWPLLLHTPW